MAATARREPSVARDMAKEMAAAAALKDQLKAVLGDTDDDAATLRDTIEGETDLLETVDAVLSQIGQDIARCEGLDKFKTTLEARAHRLKTRVETMRTMLTNTLDIIEQKKLERPLATVTLKAVAPKLNLVDEAAVPSPYWRQPEPELDRKALTDALKQRADVFAQIDALQAEADKTGLAPDRTEMARLDALLAACPPIPGAELTNGSVTVQIRFG
jgi:ABC-type transporter Mla subunit MlaD